MANAIEEYAKQFGTDDQWAGVGDGSQPEALIESESRMLSHIKGKRIPAHNLYPLGSAGLLMPDARSPPR